MSQEQAFFDDIRDHPDDDTPRLVFADWLDEHGQPDRAEFIRVQIALAHDDLTLTGRGPLLQREADLWAKHGPSWTKRLRPLLGDVRFRRGFLDRVTLDARRFLHHGEELLDAASIGHVTFHHTEGCLLALMHHCPALGRLRSIQLQGYHSRGVRPAEWLDSPYLARLRALELTGGELGLPGIRALKTAHLDSLTTLKLNGNLLGDAGIAALADAPFLPRLRTLGLAANDIGPFGVKVLLGTEAVSGLTSLNLSHNRRLGDEGVRAVAASPHLGRLTVLDLSNVSDLAPLRQLGLRELADSLYLESLTRLDLSQNKTLDEGAYRALAAARGLPSLKALALRDCGIDLRGRTGKSTAGFRELIQSGFLERLTSLDLSGNVLGADGARLLASAPGLSQLTSLSLGMSELGDEGLRALAASRHLAALTELRVPCVGCSDEGALALATSPRLSRLRVLQLEDYRLTERGRQALPQRFGDDVTR